METSYASASEARRRQVQQSKQPINGIDYLELLEIPAPSPGDRGAYLLVYLLKADGVSSFLPELISIQGGSRLTNVDVHWAHSADMILQGTVVPPPDFWAYASALSDYFYARNQFDPAAPNYDVPSRVLVVRTWTRGDLARYTLSLTSPLNVVLDRQLQSVNFAFQIRASEFDRDAAAAHVSLAADEPEIDYLAKDYGSFRRVMLDRMSTLLPDWKERSPADLGVTLVEVLAAAADYISYYQDAVATEAYLGTARQRISVRRHARLLDFVMHDGCNARTFVVLEVGSDLRLPSAEHGVVQFLTAVDTLPAAARADLLDDPSVVRCAEVFEPLHTISLCAEHNAIPFYTWGEPTAVLRKGASQATLRNRGGVKLAAGDLVLLEELCNPMTGDAGSARSDHRQIVRLTSVTYASDPLFDDKTEAPYAGVTKNPNPLLVVDIGWSAADALLFDLAIGMLPGKAGTSPYPISTARGNVVLADHGRTILPDEPLVVEDVDLAPPHLAQSPITQQGRVRDRRGALVLVDSAAAASHALKWQLRDAQPSLVLSEQGLMPSTADPTRELWFPRRDLLGSDRFAAEFVLEVDDENKAYIRFGDDFKGRRPLPGTPFSANYRVGNGSRGNISAEALRHVLLTPRRPKDPTFDAYTHPTTGILRVRNPLPGMGGIEPQNKDEVRLLAPTAFRAQARAVTEADYVAAASQHPEVQKASAVFRWTGSWHTVFIFVERIDGEPVDDAFRTRFGAFLDRYRMSRHDLQIESPRYIPLDIAFAVHVAHDYLFSSVRKALLAAFSNVTLPDGTRGFFHPDNWTFGQPVLLSRIIATAMTVPGVEWVDFSSSNEYTRFHRKGSPPRNELDEAQISIGPLEIVRLDNDASRPENGRLEFFMIGA